MSAVEPSGMQTRPWMVALVMLASVGLCAPTQAQAQAQVPAGCSSAPSVAPLDFSQPPNIDLFKRQLLYYRCTQYDDDVAAVLTEAREWVESRAAQVAKPAIVLDIDETVKSHPTPTPFRVQFRPPQVGLERAYPCSA
jgi:hypothetical protein